MATAQDNTVMTVYNGRCETSSCNLTSTLDLPALSPSEAAVVFSKRQIKEEMKLQTDGRKETKQKRGRKQTGSRDEGFDTRTQSRRSWENMAVGVVLQLGMLWQRFGFGMQWVSAEPRGYCLNPAGSFLLTDWAVRVWLLLLLISWNSPQNHLFPAIQTAGSDTVVNKLTCHRSFMVFSQKCSSGR